jgi:hypothetical protein
MKDWEGEESSEVSGSYLDYADTPGHRRFNDRQQRWDLLSAGVVVEQPPVEMYIISKDSERVLRAMANEPIYPGRCTVMSSAAGLWQLSQPRYEGSAGRWMDGCFNKEPERFMV